MPSYKLHIKGYKCFNNLEVNFRNLSVLTGMNGAGKSSTTQALRLAREASAVAGTRNNHIYLNQDNFLLGTFDEIFNTNSEKSVDTEFTISFEETGKACDSYRFFPAEEVDECEYASVEGPATGTLQNLTPTSFIYLSAERQGPRLHQEKTDGHRAKGIGVGSRGEFAAEIIANSTTTRIDPRLIFKGIEGPDDSENDLLRTNLEQWLSSIVGDIQIRAFRPPRLSRPYLEFLVPGRTADWQFPTNHGFGISYVLPIVLAGLILEENGFLIVDTPEAHLHPAAQTSLALFLARVAATGRTIIVETHSDHIVDGFRLAVADIEHPLSESDTVFHYFSREIDGAIAHVEITPRPDGTLPKWPKGFFDQISKNLYKLQQLNKKDGI